MEKLFNVIDLDNLEQSGKLVVENSSSVKSTKIFPTYEIDGIKYIYKPLSRTKPLTTPLFAYSEVYWSYVINKYFDDKAPRYYLASLSTIGDISPKYYSQGVLVESLTPNGEKMINLYDYFMNHPEDEVGIKDYVNYCMKKYDYTRILDSNFILNNPELGEEVVKQILLSILRQDQNFHFENINFYDGDKLSIVPPIDFEFSTPFLYPDNLDEYRRYRNGCINDVSIVYEEDTERKVLRNFMKTLGMSHLGVIKKNIAMIVKRYPMVVRGFVGRLDTYIGEINNIVLSDENEYIGPLNSEYWNVGHVCFKDKDIKGSELLKEKYPLREINKEYVFERINKDILEFAKRYSFMLKIYLLAFYKSIDSFEEMTLKELLCKLDFSENMMIDEIDLEYNSFTMKLNNKSII